MPAAVDAVPSARHEFSRWLSRVRVERETRDDLALVVTELVTNAVEASPGPRSQIEIRAWIESGPQVVLQVCDRGAGLQLTGSPRIPDARSVRGRGLPIVEALTDRLLVDRSDGCTVVEVSRSLSSR